MQSHTVMVGQVPNRSTPDGSQFGFGSLMLSRSSEDSHLFSMLTQRISSCTTTAWPTRVKNEDALFAHERTLVRQFGIDLYEVEERVCLQPGEMLLIDNLTTVHGRLGQRRTKEVWHLLFGLPSLSSSLLTEILQVVSGEFAGSAGANESRDAASHSEFPKTTANRYDIEVEQAIFMGFLDRSCCRR